MQLNVNGAQAIEVCERTFGAEFNETLVHQAVVAYMAGGRQGIMNFASAIMWGPQSINWNILLGYYVTGLPMDLIHAAATRIFLAVAAQPMLQKLDRIKVKYGLVK